MWFYLVTIYIYLLQDFFLQAAPVLWGQLMIVMCKVGGFWIPVCYGLLPDKEKETYYLFMVMVKHYVETHMKLKFEVEKCLLDYEIAVAQCVSSVWGSVLKGCFFHFGQSVFRYFL